MTRKEQIQKILDAIERKAYEISYIEPNCVRLKTDSDGSKYLSVSTDNCYIGLPDCGRCTIAVAGHRYTFDPNKGDWYGSDNLIGEKEVRAAISEIDGMWVDVIEDNESYAAFYCLCNGIKEEYPVVSNEDPWEDDDDEDWEEEDGDGSIDFDNYDAKIIDDNINVVRDEPEDSDEEGVEPKGNKEESTDKGCSLASILRYIKKAIKKLWIKKSSSNR